MRARHPDRQASGRFVLRIPPGLHEALRKAAETLGLSLNDYCARALAAPNGSLASLPGASESIQRAAELFGADLIGVAVFGSWVRGELTERSDIDILVVLEKRVELTRALYRTWDQAPVRWQNRTVEPNFVHLPALEERAGGLWAEIALDGIVLFDMGLRISTRLAQVRHDIVCGRIVRRHVHGQPYWTERGSNHAKP